MARHLCKPSQQTNKPPKGHADKRTRDRQTRDKRRTNGKDHPPGKRTKPEKAESQSAPQNARPISATPKPNRPKIPSSMSPKTDLPKGYNEPTRGPRLGAAPRGRSRRVFLCNPRKACDIANDSFNNYLIRFYPSPVQLSAARPCQCRRWPVCVRGVSCRVV